MYVIFDNNAARDYVAGIPFDTIPEFAKENVEKLKKNDIKMLVSPIVIMELLYHVDDPKNVSFSIAKKAIKALILTFQNQNLDKNFILATWELLIANDVFNQKIQGREDMYSSIMHCAELIAKNTFDYIPKLDTSEGGTIKDYIDSIENGFVEQVNDFVVKSINLFANPEVTDKILVSYIIRTPISLLINEKKISPFPDPINSTSEEKIEMAKNYYKWIEIVKNRYPSFLLLFKEIIKRIQMSNGQMSIEKMKNYIWDIALMFNVSDYTLKGEKVVFVTSDKAMLLSVKNENIDIYTYPEFKEKFLK